MDTSRATATIDWLSFTIHWNQDPLQRFRKAFNHEAIASALTNVTGAWLPEQPRQNYPYVLSSASVAGLSCLASEPDSPMGIHISWSGSALQTVNPRAVLRQALAMGANVTRIDIAIDTPRWLDLEGYKNALDRGQAETRARDWNLITGRKGQTLYVGSRTSEKFLRIYDKAAEQGTDSTWYRIELECKGDFARGVALHVDSAGYDYYGDIIRSFCHWPNVYCWEQTTASPTLLEGIPKPEKRRDTYAWLMSAAAPSLAKVLLDDHEKFVAFLRKVYTIAGVGDGVGEVDPFDGMADWEPRPRH